MPRLRGERPTALTPRQRQIVALVADGWPNKEIAAELGIAVRTVEHTMTDIMTRMRVTNRTELAMLAVRHPEALDGERSET